MDPLIAAVGTDRDLEYAAFRHIFNAALHPVHETLPRLALG